MIISRTPFRISFFGGGTDYPKWYRLHGGAVLAAAINKFCYLTCRHLPPFFEHRIRVVYSKIENCQTVDEIEHPAVRETLRFVGIERGVEIHHDGDLPARSGMGSSSSFTVGLLHALYALKGVMPSKHQLAIESAHIEQERLNETVGSQDQVSAAYGGVNRITFLPRGEISIRPVTVARDRLAELDSHLMLFYTGIKRTASTIANTYVQDMTNIEPQLRTLSAMVDESIAILSSSDRITRFGQLLHEAWEVKRSLSPQVCNAAISTIYDQARGAGAVGGKLLGAGGGGFMLLFVEPGNHGRVREALKTFIHVPFTFEFSGSHVIFFDPEEDYAAEEAVRLNQEQGAFQELNVRG